MTNKTQISNDFRFANDWVKRHFLDHKPDVLLSILKQRLWKLCCDDQNITVSSGPWTMTVEGSLQMPGENNDLKVPLVSKDNSSGKGNEKTVKRRHPASITVTALTFNTSIALIFLPRLPFTA